MVGRGLLLPSSLICDADSKSFRDKLLLLAIIVGGDADAGLSLGGLCDSSEVSELVLPTLVPIPTPLGGGMFPSPLFTSNSVPLLLSIRAGGFAYPGAMVLPKFWFANAFVTMPFELALFAKQALHTRTLAATS